MQNASDHSIQNLLTLLTLCQQHEDSDFVFFFWMLNFVPHTKRRKNGYSAEKDLNITERW